MLRRIKKPLNDRMLRADKTCSHTKAHTRGSFWNNPLRHVVLKLNRLALILNEAQPPRLRFEQCEHIRILNMLASDFCVRIALWMRFDAVQTKLICVL